jgi:zinc D-Ala-D-Ala carboxypeptidase
MQLSKNFHLSEFTRSATASRFNIPNTPSSVEIANLRALARNVLQPIRDHFGSPIIITSGYRSPALNKAIRGSVNSQHSKGQAADFTVANKTLIETCRFINRNLIFDQLILEFDSWIHVSYTTGSNRKQLLTINNRGTSNGIRGI